MYTAEDIIMHLNCALHHSNSYTQNLRDYAVLIVEQRFIIRYLVTGDISDITVKVPLINSGGLDLFQILYIRDIHVAGKRPTYSGYCFNYAKHLEGDHVCLLEVK